MQLHTLSLVPDSTDDTKDTVTVTAASPAAETPAEQTTAEQSQDAQAAETPVAQTPEAPIKPVTPEAEASKRLFTVSADLPNSIPDTCKVYMLDPKNVFEVGSVFVCHPNDSSGKPTEFKVTSVKEYELDRGEAKQMKRLHIRLKSDPEAWNGNSVFEASITIDQGEDKARLIFAIPNSRAHIGAQGGDAILDKDITAYLKDNLQLLQVAAIYNKRIDADPVVVRIRKKLKDSLYSVRLKDSTRAIPGKGQKDPGVFTSAEIEAIMKQLDDLTAQLRLDALRDDNDGPDNGLSDLKAYIGDKHNLAGTPIYSKHQLFGKAPFHDGSSPLPIAKTIPKPGLLDAAKKRHEAEILDIKQEFAARRAKWEATARIATTTRVEAETREIFIREMTAAVEKDIARLNAEIAQCLDERDKAATLRRELKEKPVEIKVVGDRKIEVLSLKDKPEKERAGGSATSLTAAPSAPLNGVNGVNGHNSHNGHNGHHPVVDLRAAAPALIKHQEVPLAKYKEPAPPEYKPNGLIERIIMRYMDKFWMKYVVPYLRMRDLSDSERAMILERYDPPYRPVDFDADATVTAQESQAEVERLRAEGIEPEELASFPELEQIKPSVAQRLRSWLVGEPRE